MAKNPSSTISTENIISKAKSGDLEGANLQKVSLKKTDLSKGKFKGADFTKASFKNSKLIGADFSGSNLTKADLSDCDLTGANFENADLSGIYARGAIFDNANLKCAKLKEGNFSNSSFKNVDISGADLAEAILGKSVFVSAKVSGSNLTDVDATDSEWENADLSDSDLTNASFQNCRIENLVAQNVIAPNVDFSLSSITGTKFTDSKLEGADFANTLLENVDFCKCKLANSLFNVSEQKDVNLKEADITDASFKSLSGYSEEEVMAFKERGAKVDMFLARRFYRLMKRSPLAKAIAALIILGIVSGFYLYFTNPQNWSFEKLDRVALERKGYNDFNKALLLYDIIIEKYGANHIKVAHAMVQMGHIYIVMEDYDNAEKFFNEVIENYPTLENATVLASMGLADTYKGRKNYDKAIAAYIAISTKYTDFPQAIEAKNRIAKIYVQLGDIEKARAIYEEIKQANAENAGAVVQADFDIADLFRSQGRNDQALAKYKEIYEANKEDQFIAARALSSILQMHVAMGNLDEAEKVLAVIATEFPDDLNTYLDSELFVANALSSKGKFADAEQRLRKVYMNHNDKMQGYWAGISLVDLLSSTQKFDQAGVILDELMNRWGGKDRFRIQFELKRVRLFRSQKLFKQGIDKLTKLIPEIADPDYALEADILLAELYIDSNSFDLAKAKYDQILDKYSDRPKAMISATLGLSKLYELKDEIPTSLKYLEQVVATSGNQTTVFDAQFSQVRLYRILKDAKNEERVLKEMIEMHKENANRYYLAQLTLAETYRGQGNFDEALAVLRPIADLEGSRHALSALTALVRLYADKGEVDNADKISKEMAQRFPNAKSTMISAAMDTANSLLQSGLVDKALEKFIEISKTSIGSFRVRALGSMLHIYVDRSEMDKAKEIFDILEKELPLEDEIRINAQLGMANLYRARKMYPDAEKLYQDLIDKNSGKLPAAWALASLAQAYVEQNDFAKAKTTYNQLMTDFSKMPKQVVKALLGLGSIEELQHRFKPAISYYEKAVNAAKNEDDLLHAQGSIVRLTAELGDIEKAETLLNELKTKYPNNISIIESVEFSIANAYAKTKDFDKAIQKLEMIRDKTKNKINWGNATMSIANLYHNAGHPEKAMAEFRKLDLKFPDDKNFQRAIQMGIAQIFMGQKDYNKAIKQYEKILKTFDDRITKVQALSALSRIYFEKGIVSKAESTYRRLEQIAGDDPASLYELNVGLGEIARRRGDDNLAIERYTNAYKTAPGDSQKIMAMTAIAQIYTGQGRFDKAKEAYDVIEKEFSQNTSLIVDAKLGQASVLQQNRLFDDALKLYNEVLQIAVDETTKARALVAIAQIYAALGRSEDAERTYNEVSEKFGKIKSVSLDVINGLASLYSSQGRNDEAFALYEEIEKLATDENMRLGAASARAAILIEKNNLDKAEEIFRGVLNKSKFNPNAMFNAQMGIAAIYVKRGDKGRALKLYKELYEKSKDENQSISTLNAIAQILLARKDYIGAKDVFETIIDRFGQNRGTLIDAKLGLANVYKEQKLYDKATSGYQEIIDKYSDSMQSYWAYMGLAQIQSEQGLIDDAAKTYTAIGEKFPESKSGVADAKLNLANMLKNTNRRADALNAYDEIIKLYPNEPHAIWAMQGQAQIYSEAADYEKAERIYDRIIQIPSATKSSIADAKLGKAGLLAVAGKVNDAIAAYEGLIPALDSDKALQAMTAIAHSYLAIRKLDDAEIAFKEIIRDYSSNPNAVMDASLGLGEVEMNRQNYSKAAKIFSGIAAKSDGDAMRANSALQALARTLVEQERFGEIDKIIEKIKELNPDDVNGIINIRMNVANKMRSLKMFDEAIAQLNPVIEKYSGHPQTAWAEHSKAQVLTEQQRWDEAINLYNSIIEKYDTNQTAIVDAKLNIGQIELYRGNKEKAVALFLQIASSYPEFQQSITALFNIAQVHEQAGDDAGLESVYLEILSKYEGNQTAFINANMGLGNLYVRSRKFDKAVIHFKNIYSKYPKNNQSAWALSGAARALIELGDEGQAEILLKKIIDEFPEEIEVVKGAKSTLKQLYQR